MRRRMRRRIWWLPVAAFWTVRFLVLSAVILPARAGLQLTDAIALLIFEGHPVRVVVHDRIRHDLGNPAGFIPASVESGLRHQKYGPALFYDLEAIMEKIRLERN